MNDKKIESYRKTFQKHSGGIKSIQWNSYKSAATRYRQLINDFKLDGKTILDVGCGFGDLIPYLSQQTDNFDYLGVDLLEEFIKESQNRYPERKFETLDYFANPPKESFDIVFCCGVLNGHSDNPLEERKQKISMLFNQAVEVLALNMAGGTGILNESDKIYYSDSREILDFCMTLTNKVIFKQHYHSRDFTIIMFK